MKYSVIIPVYNCICYLESCVESVINQKTDAEYEIILVDDGSLDGSAKLCDRLAEMYSCVRAIHQDNQGVSAARNAGIRAAEGVYLLFLDADDFWDERLLQCVDLATAKEPDVIQFGYCTFYEDGHVTQTLSPAVAGEESGKDYVIRILDQGIMPVMTCWASAHRKGFLTENSICFPQNVGFGEDLMFRMEELVKAHHICGVEEVLYMYRRNAASITRNMSLTKMRDICVVWPQMYEQFRKPIIADLYCMNLVSLADLTQKEVHGLQPLLKQNQKVLSAARGIKPRIVRSAFRMFGYYYGARIIRRLIEVKNG